MGPKRRMGHIVPPLPLLPPVFFQTTPKPRTEPVAGYRRSEFPPNGMGTENGPTERPPKKPKVGDDLWIAGIMAGAIATAIGALLLLACNQGRELEASEKPVKPSPTAPKNLSHKP